VTLFELEKWRLKGRSKNTIYNMENIITFVRQLRDKVNYKVELANAAIFTLHREFSTFPASRCRGQVVFIPSLAAALHYNPLTERWRGGEQRSSSSCEQHTVGWKKIALVMKKYANSDE